MEPKVSLPLLQVPATCPFSKPDQSSPHPPSLFVKIHLNITHPSTPGSSKWSLSLTLLHLNRVYTFRLSHACYMARQLILLDLISRIILSEEYRSVSSSLQSFLNSPVTSSLLGTRDLCTLNYFATCRGLSSQKVLFRPRTFAFYLMAVEWNDRSML
jgi:hypothetical protein